MWNFQKFLTCREVREGEREREIGADFESVRAARDSAWINFWRLFESGGVARLRYRSNIFFRSGCSVPHHHSPFHCTLSSHLLPPTPSSKYRTGHITRTSPNTITCDCTKHCCQPSCIQPVCSSQTKTTSATAHTSSPLRLFTIVRHRIRSIPP